jgi:hypothetical protein
MKNILQEMKYKLKYIVVFSILIFIISFISCNKDNNNPNVSDLIYSGDFQPNSLEKLKYFYEFGYNIVDGQIYINNIDSLQHLDYLSNVKLVTGNLFIGANPNLTEINGIKDIDIKGSITIAEENLEHMIDFYNVTSIDGDIYFNCPKILELNVFNNLTNVTDITIRRCFNLEILNGFNSIKDCEYIEISTNYSIKKINAFSSLTHLKGLYIVGNNELELINGFSSITEIQDVLQLRSLDVEDFNFLNNLKKVNSLGIEKCQNIIHLNNFEGVVDVGFDLLPPSIAIKDNEKLANFCGLKPCLINNTELELVTGGNAYNPNREQVIIDCP